MTIVVGGVFDIGAADRYAQFRSAPERLQTSNFKPRFWYVCTTQHILDHPQKRFSFEGLPDHSITIVADHTRNLPRAEAGHENDFQGGVSASNLVGQVDAVHPRHHHIEQCQIDGWRLAGSAEL